MKQKILIAILIIFLIAGITVFLVINAQNKSKFYLSEEYYEKEGLINIEKDHLSKIIENEDTFLLFVYNNYCSFSVPCDSIFESVALKYKISMLQIRFIDFKETEVYKKVFYSPTVIIFKDGKVLDYLDANSNDDLDKYQNSSKFENWLKKYIILRK